MLRKYDASSVRDEQRGFLVEWNIWASWYSKANVQSAKNIPETKKERQGQTLVRAVLSSSLAYFLGFQRLLVECTMGHQCLNNFLF